MKASERIPAGAPAPAKGRSSPVIAIASGKGGTGKTTVTLNLAKACVSKVQILDCDVEEPNGHLFLGGRSWSTETVNLSVPQVDESLCDGCGECGRFCAFHAIAVPKDRPILFPELCHACGGCSRVCPRGAIREIPRRIGAIETMDAGDIRLIQGLLDVGVVMSVPLIHAVKKRMEAGTPAIVDAPPGTSCPVMAAVRGADFTVLVTEPTPFGLHDLTLAVDMIRQLGIPCGVVVNRMGVGDGRVHEYCRREAIPILAEVPDDRRIAEAYSRGELIVDALPEYVPLFQELWRTVTARSQGG